MLRDVAELLTECSPNVHAGSEFSWCGREVRKKVCTDAWGQDEGREMAMGKRACKHFVYDTKYVHTSHTYICKVV